MKAIVVEKSVQYIVCPRCGDDGSHLISGLEAHTSFGPWYCKQCLTGIVGFIDHNGDVWVKIYNKRELPTSMTLGMFIRPIEG